MHAFSVVDLEQSRLITSWMDRPSRRNVGSRLAIRAGAGSAKGSRRSINQDCFFFDPEGLFLLADGMGGPQSGAVASKLAVEELAGRLTTASLRSIPEQGVIGVVNLALIETHHHIVAIGERDPKCRGMGTTIVAGLRLKSQFIIANVGDSRAYRLRGENLEQFTVDHTMAQSLVAARAITQQQAARHQWRHVLWNALGGHGGDCEPAVRVFDLRPRDRFLLTTDGLTNVISNGAIRQTMLRIEGPVDSARHLVQAAITADSSDDATCVAISCDPLDSCEAKRRKMPWSFKPRMLAAV